MLKRLVLRVQHSPQEQEREQEQEQQVHVQKQQRWQPKVQQQRPQY
jgi:hypothetical protein